jgi:alkylation response protein AidB-like acyl-CoA dehydrogenase
MWISNAKEAGVFVVFATIDPALGYKGITAFVIDKVQLSAFALKYHCQPALFVIRTLISTL